MITRVINIEDENNYPKALLDACEILNKSKVVALPTETVYGLAAKAFDQKAVESIYELKNRPSDNPLILHLGNIEQLLSLVNPDYFALANKISDSFWPGALTIVVPKSDLAPNWLTRGLDTVALRIPDSKIMRDISLTLSSPLAAPSANTSGRPSPTRASHVLQDFDSKIELIIDNGPTNFGLESSVIDITNPDEICLLRPGAISIEEIKVKLGLPVRNSEEVSDTVKSPGTKYKHYSPNCEVQLITYESNVDLDDKIKLADFSGKIMVVKSSDLNLTFSDFFNFSDIDDLTKNIFDIFRTYENSFDKIVILYPAQQTSKSVYNRLQKASGV